MLGEVTDCGEDRRTPQEPQKNIEKRNFEFCARSSHEHHHVVSYYLHPYFGSLVLRHPFTLECLFLTRTAAIMTVLLKNLFTVHFQFDLLKLETNNTRDDKVKHAWIIAR